METRIHLCDLADTAIETLRLAFQDNPHLHTNGLILAALAMVTEMRKELSEECGKCVPCDPAECCFPV